MFLYSFYVFYMNTRPNVKYLNYSLLEQVNDVKYGLIFSFVMALVVYGVGLFIGNIVLSLCIQIPLGIAIYVGLSEAIKPEAYIFARGILLEQYRKRFKK